MGGPGRAETISAGLSRSQTPPANRPGPPGARPRSEQIEGTGRGRPIPKAGSEWPRFHAESIVSTEQLQLDQTAQSPVAWHGDAVGCRCRWAAIVLVDRYGSVAKWLRQRIANPPSSVRLRPEPLLRRPLRCADNSGRRRGFFGPSRNSPAGTSVPDWPSQQSGSGGLSDRPRAGHVRAESVFSSVVSTRRGDATFSGPSRTVRGLDQGCPRGLAKDLWDVFVHQNLQNLNKGAQTLVTFNKDDLLEMLRVMQAAETAVHGYECGEMNLWEAVRLIREVAVSRRNA